MTLRRCWFGIAFLGMLLALLPVRAHAQTGTATITGLVTGRHRGGDARCHSHGHQPGDQRRPTSRVTNEAGNYTITPVTVGTYVIKAELTGFRTATTAPVALEAQTGRASRLQDGGRAIAETVEVSGVDADPADGNHRRSAK